LIRLQDDDIGKSDQIGIEGKAHDGTQEGAVVKTETDVKLRQHPMHDVHHSKAGREIDADRHKRHTGEVPFQADHECHAHKIDDHESCLDYIAGVHLLHTAQDFGKKAKREGDGGADPKDEQDFAEILGICSVKTEQAVKIDVQNHRCSHYQQSKDGVIEEDGTDNAVVFFPVLADDSFTGVFLNRCSESKIQKQRIAKDGP